MVKANTPDRGSNPLPITKLMKPKPISNKGEKKMKEFNAVVYLIVTVMLMVLNHYTMNSFEYAVWFGIYLLLLK